MPLFDWLRRGGRDREARARRPLSLGELEPELRDGPPRDVTFFDASGGALPPVIAEALREWEATRGWVVRVDVDRRDPEGPEHRVAIAWEAQGTLRHHELRAAYDAVHWARSSPAHLEWFTRAMRPGEALTLLVSGERTRVLGQCEAFVRRGGVLEWLAG